jgi:hypothetical protein
MLYHDRGGAGYNEVDGEGAGAGRENSGHARLFRAERGTLGLRGSLQGPGAYRRERWHRGAKAGKVVLGKRRTFTGQWRRIARETDRVATSLSGRGAEFWTGGRKLGQR